MIAVFPGGLRHLQSAGVIVAYSGLFRFDELEHLRTHFDRVSVAHEFGEFTEKEGVFLFQAFQLVLGNRFAGILLLMKAGNLLRGRGCSKDKGR